VVVVVKLLLVVGNELWDIVTSRFGTSNSNGGRRVDIILCRIPREFHGGSDRANIQWCLRRKVTDRGRCQNNPKDQCRSDARFAKPFFIVHRPIFLLIVPLGRSVAFRSSWICNLCCLCFRCIGTRKACSTVRRKLVCFVRWSETEAPQKRS
jgi:hypothetical protein